MARHDVCGRRACAGAVNGSPEDDQVAEPSGANATRIRSSDDLAAHVIETLEGVLNKTVANREARTVFAGASTVCEIARSAGDVDTHFARRAKAAKKKQGQACGQRAA